MVVFVSYGPSPAFGQKKSAPLGARCGDDPAAGRADNHRVGPLFLKIAAFCCSFICRWRRSSSAEYMLSSISRGGHGHIGEILAEAVPGQNHLGHFGPLLRPLERVVIPLQGGSIMGGRFSALFRGGSFFRLLPRGTVCGGGRVRGLGNIGRGGNGRLGGRFASGFRGRAGGGGLRLLYRLRLLGCDVLIVQNAP